MKIKKFVFFFLCGIKVDKPRNVGSSGHTIDRLE